MVEMAAPTRARARVRARAGPHPACVRAHVQVATALSTESAPFYRMAHILGIPRKRRFLKSAEHIYTTSSLLVPSAPPVNALCTNVRLAA